MVHINYDFIAVAISIHSHTYSFTCTCAHIGIPRPRPLRNLVSPHSTPAPVSLQTRDDDCNRNPISLNTRWVSLHTFRFKCDILGFSPLVLCSY